MPINLAAQLIIFVILPGERGINAQYLWKQEKATETAINLIEKEI